MALPLLEKSKYYKGLLVLARRDRVIAEPECEYMLRIGRMLDFDPRFCKEAIDDVLRNPHITDEPILFSSRETAECFLHDGLRLALIDEKMHSKELAWLRLVAQANQVAGAWLDAEIRHIQETKDLLDQSASLAIQRYL